ncbi:MAG: signal peptidase I [Bernardetiaceae bacterium]|nr:signal peptidase I [Bernardetiaceae bacterium]
MKHHNLYHSILNADKKCITFFEKLQYPLAFLLGLMLFLFVVRVSCIEYFSIPSSSMEGALLKGDKIISAKMRLSNLSTLETASYYTHFHQHQSNNFFNFAWTSIRHNDIIIFNFPPEVKKNIAEKTCYIKRCVGLPGDTLRIEAQRVSINSEALKMPANQQLEYLIICQEDKLEALESYFEELNIHQYRRHSKGFVVLAGDKKLELLHSLPDVTHIETRFRERGQRERATFPQSEYFHWNRDFLGPVYIPQRGAQIPLTPQNVILYGELITRHEGHENMYIQDNKIYADGVVQKTYTFRQNYYFMLGDNRHNSSDSRTWGFVPENHIIGKPLWIYQSLIDKDRIRWSRIGMAIR